MEVVSAQRFNEERDAFEGRQRLPETTTMTWRLASRAVLDHRELDEPKPRPTVECCSACELLRQRQLETRPTMKLPLAFALEVAGVIDPPARFEHPRVRAPESGVPPQDPIMPHDCATQDLSAPSVVTRDAPLTKVALLNSRASVREDVVSPGNPGVLRHARVQSETFIPRGVDLDEALRARQCELQSAEEESPVLTL